MENPDSFKSNSFYCNRCHYHLCRIYSVAGHNLFDGLAFAVALLAILGIHETAHYYAARKHEVKSTLPYFIPAPTLIGTFGAVINIKSPIPDKNSLFDRDGILGTLLRQQGKGEPLS